VPAYAEGGLTTIPCQHRTRGSEILVIMDGEARFDTVSIEPVLPGAMRESL
jgi:hypothetical protein